MLVAEQARQFGMEHNKHWEFRKVELEGHIHNLLFIANGARHEQRVRPWFNV